MSRDPRYDTLFEPVRIGPVTAKNRFYQVPHCNGMGFKWPQSHAKMREVKAEGGWAVICTEECMIHATSDGTPYPQGRLWDDGDIELLALFVEGVHRHGALAGVELVHHGQAIPNLFTREYPIAPCDHVNKHNDPVQARAMDKADIRAFRGWHRKAALRARSADVDLVYVYAAHDLALPQHFLSRRRNQRTDEYGGSLENRARLLRELIEETKDAVGDRCGVVVRFAVDEMVGDDGITAGAEGREVIEMLGELPDMWDVNISDFSKDAPTSQFQTEGHQEPYIAFVKTLTTKPVVGVGWFTSPDTMASQVRRGVLDMIGCARPSIADPFLPRKIPADPHADAPDGAWREDRSPPQPGPHRRKPGYDRLRIHRPPAHARGACCGPGDGATAGTRTLRYAVRGRASAGRSRNQIGAPHRRLLLSRHHRGCRVRRPCGRPGTRFGGPGGSAVSPRANGYRGAGMTGCGGAFTPLRGPVGSGTCRTEGNPRCRTR